MKNVVSCGLFEGLDRRNRYRHHLKELFDMLVDEVDRDVVFADTDTGKRIVTLVADQGFDIAVGNGVTADDRTVTLQAIGAVEGDITVEHEIVQIVDLSQRTSRGDEEFDALSA